MPNWMPDLVGATGPTGPTGDGAAGFTAAPVSIGGTTTQQQIDSIVELQSLKRRLLPVDVARACLFLCSELSDGITGQTLNVDGGWVMH